MVVIVSVFVLYSDGMAGELLRDCLGTVNMIVVLGLYSDDGVAGDLLGDGKRAAKRYLPFSEGPRSCAGSSLAKVNMTATLASLLGNFSFRLADEVLLPTSLGT
jgi:hypothetical protein